MKRRPGIGRSLLILVPIGVLAALRLFDPFDGDQALFLLGARMLNDGAVLYRDFWDIKQPGIFWFYQIAGSLFGFTQEGVRLFELIWLLGFGAVLVLTLRPVLGCRPLAVVAPIAFLGTHFGYASFWDLTQVEVLASPLIYVAACFLARPYDDGRTQGIGFACAGMCAAAAVVFKLVFALIFIPLLVVAILGGGDPARPTPLAGKALRLTLWFGLGVALGLAPVIAWFAAEGALGPLVWTTFAVPLQVLGSIPAAPIERLAYLGGEGVRRAWPWLILALIAAARCCRRSEPVLMRLMVAWALTGVFVIVVQKLSWWPHHLPLVLAPISVLAARGTDVLYTRVLNSARFSRFVPMFTMVILLPGVLIAALPVWERANALIASRHEISPAEIYRRRLSGDYDSISADVGFLAAAPSGPIYVVGNPLYYLLSGRKQAGAIHSWAWEMMPDTIWQALPEEISAMTPIFVYMDAYHEALMLRRHPEIVMQILIGYRLHHRHHWGTWYVRRDRPEARTTPSPVPPAAAP